MLHVGRSGSTVLADLLDQNPGVHWDGKLYRKAVQYYRYKTLDKHYASWTQRQYSASGAKYYGFEFKILQDQYPQMLGVSLSEFLEQSKRMGVTHYILLVRKNTLRHLVSHYSSKKRGSWHVTKPDTIKKLQFELNVNSVSTGSGPGRSLLQYLEEVEEAHDRVRNELRDAKFLEIHYESDIEEKGADPAYQKICEFLELEACGVEIKYNKINSFPMQETILNFESVAESLRSTRFEWMLEDSRNR
jgi:hypothetical protein